LPADNLDRSIKFVKKRLLQGFLADHRKTMPMLHVFLDALYSCSFLQPSVSVANVWSFSNFRCIVCTGQQKSSPFLSCLELRTVNYF